ncbi:hypothetical protein DDE82_009045 [Stemphylium lycopersici]|uniref:Uncharacterized protein n=1 Tax=Stemphylium lycopersici TaxID=183478 RepID=A0A364MSD8_STELY|nr:hypothetical protein TW65_99363 [Stemphylium lycopersici]RAQ98650.1 hypothetical protein DDE82_009045 [Stemphylium lycopersici]RAR01996.1 hypothetical protein DDE83_008720 [Stemphylium lycopersici]
MAQPPRGAWAGSGGRNHLAHSTGGSNNSTYSSYFENIMNRAQACLTRTQHGAVVPANINVDASNVNLNDYQVWYILDLEVANELRRLLATHSPEVRRVAEFFLRPAGDSPYDARWGPGIDEWSPVVARTTIQARQLLTGRASYVKAYVIHSRGALNATPCGNNCAAAVRGSKGFTAFAGCVSIADEWNGACSNCVWQEHGAQCSHRHTGRAPRPIANPRARRGRAIQGPDQDAEQLVDA